MSRDLQDAGLGRLDPVAHPRGQQHQRGVGRGGDLDLGLTDPDRLHDHACRSRRRRRPAAPGAPRRTARRAGHGWPSSGCRPRGPGRAAASVPGHRAAPRPRTASSGRPPAPPPARPLSRSAATKALVVVDLPTPGRPGDADDVRPSGVRGERLHDRRQLGRAVLDQRDQPPDRPRPAWPDLRDQRLAGQPPATSSGSRARHASGSTRRPARRRRTAPPRRCHRPAAAAPERESAPTGPPRPRSGGPRAIAPPLTLTRSSISSASSPSARALATPTAANASLISIRSRSRDAELLLLARRVDRVGRLQLQRGVRPGHRPVRPDLGDHGQTRAARPPPGWSRPKRPRRRRSGSTTRP